MARSENNTDKNHDWIGSHNTKRVHGVQRGSNGRKRMDRKEKQIQQEILGSTGLKHFHKIKGPECRIDTGKEKFEKSLKI